LPRNKHSWHQLPHSSDAKMIHLVPTYGVRKISSGTSSATDSKFTTHRRQFLGAALAALNHLEDSLVIRRLQANVRVAAAKIEERGPGYSRSAASSYTRSRSERPCQRCRSQGPLDPVAEEGRGENEVAQPVNAAANAPANPVLTPQQTIRSTPLVTSPTTQPMLPTFRQTSLRIQDTTQEPRLL
jgi:hypothetical protein